MAQLQLARYEFDFTHPEGVKEVVTVGFKDAKKCNKKSSVVSTSKRGSRGELSNQPHKLHRRHLQLANLRMSPVDTDIT